MFNTIVERPRFRPAINVGALMDIPTGVYKLGKYGESIMSGGLYSFTGIAARPNDFKTHLLTYLAVRVRAVMRQSHGLTYDTDGTMDPVTRFTVASIHDEFLRNIDWEHDDQYAFTDLSRYIGDDFFEILRTTANEKSKDEKKYTITTPFLDPDGNNKTALYPTFVGIDTYSKFQVSAVEKMYDKNKIGDSGNNTDAMTSGKAKNQMINQLPGILARSGFYAILTAHVGDVINVEMYPTDKRQLKDLQKDTSLKGVGSAFYGLPNNLWSITGKAVLWDKDKMPEYPSEFRPNVTGDKDLVELTMINLRGKNGGSGTPIKLVASQSEGILPGLSQFHFCKNADRYGIGGNLQNYFLDMLPSVSLSRTKVRAKLANDARLRKAMEFTSDMLQIRQWQRTIDPELHCTPKEMVDDLTAMGYDWERLLDTRSYWVPLEEEALHEKPFLTTMDLMRMRKGLYIPYWFTDEEKAKIKKPHLVAK